MALNIFDLTLKWKPEISDLLIVNDLKSLAKKWGFQQEIGEKTGYKHYQIRMSLIKKTTKNNLINLLKQTNLSGAHVSPTSNNCKDIYYYCTKEQTRVPNTKPYTDKDKPPPEMTRQLREFLKFEPYEWQKQAYDIALSTNCREINFIYDPQGNNGKSIFCEWLDYEEIADEIPTSNSYEEISSYVCSRRGQGFKSNCYLIDMPRGLKKEKLAQFYSGIETIKNGICFDKRYSASKIRFDRPQIIIFTNTVPKETECLSKDRWKIYCLNQEFKRLSDITEQVIPGEPLIE